MSLLPEVNWQVAPFLLLRYQPLALGPFIETTTLGGKHCVEDKNRLSFLGVSVVTQKQRIELKCP